MENQALQQAQSADKSIGRSTQVDNNGIHGAISEAWSKQSNSCVRRGTVNLDGKPADFEDRSACPKEKGLSHDQIIKMLKNSKPADIVVHPMNPELPLNHSAPIYPTEPKLHK